MHFFYLHQLIEGICRRAPNTDPQLELSVRRKHIPEGLERRQTSLGGESPYKSDPRLHEAGGRAGKQRPAQANSISFTCKSADEPRTPFFPSLPQQQPKQTRSNTRFRPDFLPPQTAQKHGTGIQRQRTPGATKVSKKNGSTAQSPRETLRKRVLSNLEAEFE